LLGQEPWRHTEGLEGGASEKKLARSIALPELLGDEAIGLIAVLSPQVEVSEEGAALDEHLDRNHIHMVGAVHYPQVRQPSLPPRLGDKCAREKRARTELDVVHPLVFFPSRNKRHDTGQDLRYVERSWFFHVGMRLKWRERWSEDE